MNCKFVLKKLSLPGRTVQSVAETMSISEDEGKKCQEQAAKVIGQDTVRRLKELTLQLYSRGVEYARTRGIIVCDTKFEFGLIDGKISIVDEMLTPDSSRFWPADQYSPGKSQPSFDKQFVRDYLEKIGWNKQPPAPELPDDIVNATSAKYVEALRLLTGRDLQ